MSKIQPKNKEELIQFIKLEIELHGNHCDLNHIDTSLINDMNSIFSTDNNLHNFNGDISKWNTSNVVSMGSMFRKSQFNGDISQWDTSNVNSMSSMFAESLFNQDISNWNVSKLYYLTYTFYNSQFTQNLNNWKPINIRKLKKTFAHTPSSFIIPFWSDFEFITDLEQRQQKIDSFHLNNKIVNQLPIKKSTINKI